MPELNPVAPVSTVAPISNTPYATPVAPASATLTAGMSSTEAKSILANLGINVQDVLGAQNVAQTINAPAPKPDDLLGIRNQLYNEQGVNTAQAALTAANKAASDAALGLNERLTGLRGRAVSINKITGQQAQERAVSQGEIDALNESARLAQLDYAAKKGNADEMFQIRNQEISEKKAIMLQYPGAKVSFGDSMEQVTKKLTNYQKEQEKDAYKKTLKAKALDLGIKTSGSTKDLEKRISKANKSALQDAKDEHNLKMESLKMDIENTKSTISARNAANKTTFNPKDSGDIIGRINQGVAEGYSWEEISGVLAAKGVDTKAGSLADNELRRVNGLEPVQTFPKASSSQDDMIQAFLSGQ